MYFHQPVGQFEDRQTVPRDDVGLIVLIYYYEALDNSMGRSSYGGVACGGGGCHGGPCMVMVGWELLLLVLGVES